MRKNIWINLKSKLRILKRFFWNSETFIQCWLFLCTQHTILVFFSNFQDFSWARETNDYCLVTAAEATAPNSAASLRDSLHGQSLKVLGLGRWGVSISSLHRRSPNLNHDESYGRLLMLFCLSSLTQKFYFLFFSSSCFWRNELIVSRKLSSMKHKFCVTIQ
jgi:hypothetical protein